MYIVPNWPKSHFRSVWRQLLLSQLKGGMLVISSDTGQSCSWSWAVWRSLLSIPKEMPLQWASWSAQSSLTDSLRLFYSLFLEYVKKINVPVSLNTFSGIQFDGRINVSIVLWNIFMFHSSKALSVCIPTTICKNDCLPSLANSVCGKSFCQPARWEVVPHCCFRLYVPIVSKAEHWLMLFRTLCVSFLLNCLR